MVFHSVFRWPSLKWFFVPRNPARSKASLGEARKAVAAACTSNSLLRSKASAALRGKSWAVVPAKTKPFRNGLEMWKEWRVECPACSKNKTPHLWQIYRLQGHLQKSFQKEGLHTASKFRNCSLNSFTSTFWTLFSFVCLMASAFWVNTLELLKTGKSQLESPTWKNWNWFFESPRNDSSGTLNLWMLSKWQH